ncbi:aldo/keto reductase [Flavobacterium pectinovorum]|uniref:Aldo/keto reductase n=1 Tax=Flavobacterium pectinovorum TaxID=29533 RepID=A0A502F2S5_9FLAO|nr:aldo/keto reductase [Flavobacterium pectinovorum]TPG44458.1 aldo/keto reductase [Flavobacterium pectinovorum]
MKMRKLGINGPEVSPISMGSRLIIDDPTTLEMVKKQTIQTLQYGIDSGINFLNTADFYGMGMSELIIGEAIKGRRDKAFISVKTGALRDHKGHFLGLDGRPNAIKNFCAYSLTRLGVDEIDLLQPSRIDPNVPIEETVGAIKDLIDEGKVRYLGLSEANAEQLIRAHKVHPVAALEIEYSLATRFIENEILPTARELGVSIVPYSVLSYGLLTGNLEFPLPKGDYRNMLPRFQEENRTHNLQMIEFLKDMAIQKNVSASQLALAWALHQGEDIIPIVGMSKPKRVDENIAALSIEFSAEEMNLLNTTFAIGAMKGDRYPAALQKMAAS